MPLVLGNWRKFRVSLAKTSIILSAVPSVNDGGCSQCGVGGLVAYSSGWQGDRAAHGMNI